MLLPLLVASVAAALSAGQQVCPAGSWPSTTCAPVTQPPLTPPLPGAAAAVHIVTAPPVGSGGPISGFSTGAPAGAQIALYLTCGNAVWGAKPAATTTFPARRLKCLQQRQSCSVVVL